MQKFELQKIDECLLSEHSCLKLNDECYFWGEYAGGQGPKYSEMNQIIYNFKKYLSQKGKPDWHYKDEAIKKVTQLLLTVRVWSSKLKYYTWVPIPPSKMKFDAEYDDRLIRVLQNLKKNYSNLDIREFLKMKSSRHTAHSGKRLTVQEHLANLTFDQNLKDPKPKAIAILDDVITSGASFKAGQIVLKKQFPNVPIIGIFIARSIKVEDSTNKLV